MINMAVLNLKDIVKYLIKITLVIAIVIGMTKYFSIAKILTLTFTPFSISFSVELFVSSCIVNLLSFTFA